MKTLFCDDFIINDSYDRFIVNKFIVNPNEKIFIKIDKDQIHSSLNNIYIEIRSDDIFHFTDNFSQFMKFSLETFNKHENKIIIKILIQPDEANLYSKILLLRFSLNVNIEIDFDYGVLDKYTLAELFYLEDCLFHLNSSFKDTSWFRIIPFEEEEIEDALVNDERISCNKIDLIPDIFKQIINQIKKRQDYHGLNN